MSARKVKSVHWEAQRGDGTPFREFATRKQALEYVCEFRRLDATGAGRRVVKVTRYAGRGLTQAHVDAAVAKAVAAERERCVAWIVAWRRDMPMSPCELEATIAYGKAAP